MNTPFAKIDLCVNSRGQLTSVSNGRSATAARIRRERTVADLSTAQRTLVKRLRREGLTEALRRKLADNREALAKALEL